MAIGEYIKILRKEKGLSQRVLGELANVSNTEISRIESGERIKPSPEILKAIAPHLGVDYLDLMRKANYIEEVVENNGIKESILRNDDGSLADIVRVATNINQKDSELFVIMTRATEELPQEDLDKIKEYAEGLMLLKDKKK